MENFEVVSFCNRIECSWVFLSFPFSPKTKFIVPKAANFIRFIESIYDSIHYGSAFLRNLLKTFILLTLLSIPPFSYNMCLLLKSQLRSDILINSSSTLIQEYYLCSYMLIILCVHVSNDPISFRLPKATN